MSYTDAKEAVIAGSKHFGVWSRAIHPIDNPLLRQLVSSHLNSNLPITVIDAGSGNGNHSYLAFDTLARARQLTVHYLDVQAEAIEQTKQLVTNHPFPEGTDTHHYVHDLTEPLPLKPESADIAILDSVLHWVDMKGQIAILEEIASVLKPWAYLYISVCSLYNAACLGNQTNCEERLRMQHIASNGARHTPFSRWHSRYGRDMHFFTPGYMGHLLKITGFRVSVGPYEFKNGWFPNNLGNRFKENLAVLAQKN